MILLVAALRSRLRICCALISMMPVLMNLVGCLPDNLNGDSSSDEVLGFNPGSPSEQATSESPDGLGTDPSTTDAAETIISFEPNVPTSHVEAEPNNTWEQAEVLPFGGQLTLRGTMAGGALDVDVFEIGPAWAGQRLQAELANNGADIQLGLFDGSRRVIACLDPISPTAGPAQVDVVLHEAISHLYVMVATRSISATARAYQAVVTLSSNLSVPRSRPQAVVLVFGGASQVRIGSRSAIDVPAFDIGVINADFAGETEAAIQLLVQDVREDYAGLNVTFYRDTDLDRPVEGYTSIYFGTSDTRLLGLADNIDPYNSDSRQSAILYTDTFSLFNQLRPGFDSTVRALANVTSHEAGHLLGLRHTADTEDLMDVTASARQMMMDQYFKSANLHSSVLPFGRQDAPTMLGWGAGGMLDVRFQPDKTTQLKPIAPGGPDDFYIPRSMLADCGCMECDRAAGSE